MRRVPFFRHDLGQREIDEIAKVIAGPILTTGDTVKTFEDLFSAYLKNTAIPPKTLGVTSCTGAIHLALLALGIGEGDEVITTPLTFIASSTAIMQAGAKPVFVDVEPRTGNIDINLIEAAITPRTKAILPVHLYGLMVDMLSLKAIADKHRLFIVEDCAHCIEGERAGVRPAQLSDAACFSFYATKNITCGEGGAVVVNDQALYEAIRIGRLHGMDKTANDRYKDGYSHWDMLSMGWKYNMDNIQAAMLIPQFERINSNLAKRELFATLYQRGLCNIEELSFFDSSNDAIHARHLFPIRIKQGRRDELIHYLQEHGIGCVVNYNTIHLLTYFRTVFQHKKGDFPVAETLGEQTLSLPFYPSMSEDDIHYVIEMIKCFYSQ